MDDKYAALTRLFFVALLLRMVPTLLLCCDCDWSPTYWTPTLLPSTPSTITAVAAAAFYDRCADAATSVTAYACPMYSCSNAAAVTPEQFKNQVNPPLPRFPYFSFRSPKLEATVQTSIITWGVFTLFFFFAVGEIFGVEISILLFPSSSVLLQGFVLVQQQQYLNLGGSRFSEVGTDLIVKTVGDGNNKQQLQQQPKMGYNHYGMYVYVVKDRDQQ